MLQYGGLARYLNLLLTAMLQYDNFKIYTTLERRG